MKITFTFFITLTSFILVAQQSRTVYLNINHYYGGAPFEMDASYKSPDGYRVQAKRLQYYISNIQLHFENGQVLPAEDVYLLVNAMESEQFLLGDFPAENLKSIELSIGVDEAKNHLDPSAYPAGHALGNHFPSMHWGWAAGYRFVAYEGFTDRRNGIFTDEFQIHTVGDPLYRTFQIDLQGIPSGNAITINLDAEYKMLLDGINVYGGVISHGSNGVAVATMDNCEKVFSASPVTTSNADLSVTNPSCMVFPNPSSGEVFFQLKSFKTSPSVLRVFNQIGQEVFSVPIENQNWTTPRSRSFDEGLYIYSLESADRILERGKFVIAK